MKKIIAIGMLMLGTVSSAEWNVQNYRNEFGEKLESKYGVNYDATDTKVGGKAEPARMLLKEVPTINIDDNYKIFYVEGLTFKTATRFSKSRYIKKIFRPLINKSIDFEYEAVPIKISANGTIYSMKGRLESRDGESEIRLSAEFNDNFFDLIKQMRTYDVLMKISVMDTYNYSHIIESYSRAIDFNETYKQVFNITE